MKTRRAFAADLETPPPAASTACSGTVDQPPYDEVGEHTYRHADRLELSRPAAYRELVRYVTMAASSHNSQPWVFRVAGDQIRVTPDSTRLCPTVDPDLHHVFASLGCAVENMMIAAGAFGLHGDLMFDKADSSISIFFDRTKPLATPAFQMIPERQCTRAAFNGVPVSIEVLKQIEAFATSPSVGLQFLTEEKQRRQIIDYVVAGNSIQMNDGAFVEELRSWIRFNQAEALASGDGLSYRAAGSPAAPRWLGRILFSIMFRKGTENQKYRDQIVRSSGIAIFSCAEQTKAAWVGAGRAYQRFALASTALGLRHAFINQPVEVPEIRCQLASYLNLGKRSPDLIVRFGYGDPTPRTLRRPVDDVLVHAA